MNSVSTFVNNALHLVRAPILKMIVGARDSYNSMPFVLQKSLERKLSALDLRPTIPKKTRLPKNAHIEITNSCNLNCVMCQTKEQKRRIGLMSEETFTRAVDQLKDAGVREVALHTVGETFVHKHLDRFIKIIHKAGMKASISTNAQFPEKMIELAQNNPEAITGYRFSLEAVEKNKYELFRRGGQQEKLIDSFEVIKRYNETNRKLSVNIKALIGPENYEDVKDVLDLKKKYPFIKNVKFNLIDKNNATRNDLNYQLRYGKEKRLGSETGGASFENLFGGYDYCRQVYTGAHVTFNGEVTLCCRDYEADIKVGNIFDNSITELWNSGAAEELRRKYIGLNGEIPAAACIGCETAIGSVVSILNDFIEYKYRKFPSMDRYELGESINLFLTDLNRHGKKYALNDIFSEMSKHIR
jgi:MoaA/NifB/PqqE/SkfB family radical SAM enzyme